MLIVGLRWATVGRKNTHDPSLLIIFYVFLLLHLFYKHLVYKDEIFAASTEIPMKPQTNLFLARQPITLC